MLKTTWNFGLTRAGAQEDVAQFSLWTSYPNPAFAPGEFTVLGPQIAGHDIDAWQDNMTAGNFSPAVHLVSVREDLYDASLTLQEVAVVTDGVTWVGSSAGRGLPWETSMCISLYTYTPGGYVPNARRRRGRYYLPPMGASVLNADNSGRLDDDVFVAVADDSNDFLTAVATNHIDTDGQRSLGVVSRVANQFYQLTDIVHGNKIDSQRRRENSEAETRSASTFVQPGA